VLQCVAVCCSTLQCVLQCVAVDDEHHSPHIPVLHRVLQCVAVCCSRLQCVFQCVAVDDEHHVSCSI